MRFHFRTSFAALGLTLAVSASAFAAPESVELPDSSSATRCARCHHAAKANVLPIAEPHALHELSQPTLDADGEAGRAHPESGWQLQLRFGWYHLQHNNRNNVLAGNNDDQRGWSVGVAFVAPIWEDLGPVDLMGYLAIEYRQLRKSGKFVSPLTGPGGLAGAAGLTTDRGTISALRINWGPMIRIPVTDMIRPYVVVAGALNVNSPPSDSGVTYVDLGLTVGGGVDLKVHKKLSIGLDYMWTAFGAADADDDDFGQLTTYIAFNF